MIYAILYLLYRLNLKACIANINSRAHMIAPKGKPVICEELARNDVDRLTKTMKMAINSAEVCEQSSLCLALAVDKVDCFAVTKRLSKRTGLPKTIDKIVNFIATKLIKLLTVIVFLQKKVGGGKRTI